jgi:DNA recombination protein RmuC
METLFVLFDRPVTPAEAMLAGGVALFFVVALLLVWRSSRAGRRVQEEAAARAAELESQLGALLAAQSAMTGRMQAMAEMMGSRQADMSKAVSERLDGMTHRLNQSVGEATKNTHESLKSLHERLAVLDAAQQNISDLTGQVTTLSNILGNKQSRGLFGQGRMEAIVSDHLPPGAFAFQFTLKCGHRPDCVVHLPNGAPPLVIDAKFPLEGYNAVKGADSPETLKSASRSSRATSSSTSRTSRIAISSRARRTTRRSCSCPPNPCSPRSTSASTRWCSAPIGRAW